MLDRSRSEGTPSCPGRSGPARSLGIAAIYQQPALFPDLTVAENIAIGLEPGGAWRRVRWPDTAGTRPALARANRRRIDPQTEVRRLSMPEQQLVEIARALGASAHILIMDEPTASLSDQEVARLFRVINDLKAQGKGIIYISHRLEELPEIADRVTTLRDGVLIGTRRMSEVSRTELIRMMVGRELAAVFPKTAARLGEIVLETRGLSLPPPRCPGHQPVPFVPARSLAWPAWSAQDEPSWQRLSSA